MRLAFAICAYSSLAFSQGPPSLFGFLPNSGQFPPAIRFVRYASNNFVYLTSDSFVLLNLVRIQIAGIAPNVQPVGVSPATTVFNFYEGNNSSQWSTNTQMFGGVQLNNVYPGVNATFTTSLNSIAPDPGFGQGEIVFSIAAGADPSPIQINVLNTGASPMQGPGAGLNSVYFAGGRIPGVFAVGAQATQPTGGAGTAVTCNLIINASGSLSIQLPIATRRSRLMSRSRFPTTTWLTRLRRRGSPPRPFSIRPPSGRTARSRMRTAARTERIA